MVARRLATEGVPGRVSDRVCLSLYDTTAEPARSCVVYDDLADQEAGQGYGVCRELGPPKAPQSEGR